MNLVFGPGVTARPEQVQSAPVFRDWADRLGMDWQGTVTVTDVDFWGDVVHGLQVTVAAEGDPWPSKLTLRSETVDVFVGITDGQREYVAFVEQYRPAVGGPVVSNVAGGRGWSESVLVAAEREVREELELDADIPIKLSRLLPSPVLATPGLTNERVHMLQALIRVTARQLDALLERLPGRRTGVADEGESIVIHIIRTNQALQFIWHQPNPDGKTLLSLRLAGL